MTIDGLNRAGRHNHKMCFKHHRAKIDIAGSRRCIDCWKQKIARRREKELAKANPKPRRATNRRHTPEVEAAGNASTGRVRSRGRRSDKRPINLRPPGTEEKLRECKTKLDALKDVPF